MEYKDILEQERELRDDPLAALLRENRPQPPRESRAQVRQTLDRIETPPFARVGTFARRAPWGFAAACIALVLLLSGTVYAISSWVGREDYHPGDYITTPADQRTVASAVPEIEQMVRGAAPQSESCRFVMLPEMSDADSLNWWRVKMGQKAYDEADWAWVREIRPEIQEVLYDGTAFAYTVRLHTDHAAVFSKATATSIWKLWWSRPSTRIQAERSAPSPARPVFWKRPATGRASPCTIRPACRSPFRAAAAFPSPQRSPYRT